MSEYLYDDIIILEITSEYKQVQEILKGELIMCREDRDDLWLQYQSEGGGMSREEFEYQCDVDDYGMDESDNDPWDE